MKPAWLLIAIFASVLAGAGGGYVATHYLGDAQPKGNTVAAAPIEDLGTDDSSADRKAQDDKIAKLNGDLNALMVRLEAAERAGAENAKLKDDIKGLESKIAELKKAGAVVAATDGNGNPVAPANAGSMTPGTPEFDAAVAEAMEKKAAEDRAARDAERQKRMEEMMANRNKTIVDKLSTELSLTETQKTNITAVLEDMNTKRGEVWKRGEEARTNGTEFDWRAEMKTVNDNALEAVKSELSSAQLSTFNELVGEDGSLDSLAGGWGGRGGFGGGGGNRGGGNRGGGQGGGRGN